MRLLRCSCRHTSITASTTAATTPAWPTRHPTSLHLPSWTNSTTSGAPAGNALATPITYSIRWLNSFHERVRYGQPRLFRQPRHIRPAAHAPQHPNLHHEGGATYEYGSPAAGATTIQRAISGREVSSPHGDPAGHYPGSECLTPPPPPWPTVARENYPLPDTTLLPPLSSSSPRNSMRTMPTTHFTTARDRRTPSRSSTTCVHGRRGGAVTRATRGGASKVG